MFVGLPHATVHIGALRPTALAARDLNSEAAE
jgi:hypothetical protein